MSAYEVEKLTRDNRNLQQQLKTTSHSLSILQGKENFHQQLYRKWNKQRQYLQQQIRQLRRREEEMKYEKEETENRYLNVLRKLEDELEDRKTKYMKLETKIQPLVDHDSVRLKILNQVETVHFMELEEFKRKNNQLKDQVLKLKRQNQLFKHQLQNNKIEHEDQIRRLRNSIEDRNKSNHLNELTYEMCLDMENKLRINYDQAKKEADYYRDKYFCSEKKYQERVNQLEKQVSTLKQQIFK